MTAHEHGFPSRLQQEVSLYTIALELQEVSFPKDHVTIISTVPSRFMAFRPESFLFCQPECWDIIHFMIGSQEQLRARVRASHFDTALLKADQGLLGTGPGHCTTMESRQVFSMLVVYLGAAAPLPFRCEMTGPGALFENPVRA